MSNYFQPFDVVPFNQSSVHNPQEDSISARLLTSYGIVRQAGPGTYHLLPLGLRAQTKLENLIDEELQNIGCSKLSMPHLTSGKLWKKSGRHDLIGPELISFKDRHGKKQVLSPTHEESITSMLATLPFLNARDLPIKLYQTGAKFRDEMRPKFGLIRANEFTMKDLYTFDKDIEDAKKTYEKVKGAYRKIFNRLGVPFVVVEGDSGLIGGNISHEYHFPAPIGQDTLFVRKDCGTGWNVELGGREQSRECEVEMTKGIEVGHTFLLGDKYSKPFNAVYKTNSVPITSVPYQMGCYGIGVSRVLAASVEVLSSQTELRWPEAIAPFTVAILAPKGGSTEAASMDLVKDMQKLIGEIFIDDVIVDDRDRLTVGRKLREARKTGYPYVLLFGKKCVDSDPMLELHMLNRNKVLELRPSEVIENLTLAKQRTGNTQ